MQLVVDMADFFFGAVRAVIAFEFPVSDSLQGIEQRILAIVFRFAVVDIVVQEGLVMFDIRNLFPESIEVNILVRIAEVQ